MSAPLASALRATLLAQFANAEAAVDASDARVRQRSADRLRTILQNPDLKRRLAALNDPALTPLDRATLEQAILESVPRERSRISIGLHDRLQRLMRQTGYRRRAIARGAVIVLLLSSELFSAYVHTPVARPIRLARAFEINWTLPDGSVRQEREEENTRVILLRTREGGLVLRRWFAGIGYGESLVNKQFVQTETYPSD